MKTAIGTSRIAIVGEAWGQEEALRSQPFVGPTGRFLDYLLRLASIDRRQCLVTNVFNLQPQPTNDVKNLCGTKAEGIPGLPQLATGKYVKAKYAPELARLHDEINTFKPNVIIALGATAAWALLGKAGIKKVRGAPTEGYNGYKVVPSYHPTAVMRQYSLYPVLVADLQKAERESYFPDVRRPQRLIHVEPDYDDLLSFEHKYIEPATRLSVDIETAGNQITCIGFAPSPERALVIPIVDETKADHNYWPTQELEVLVWRWIAKQLARPISIFGQNFNYDMKFILMSYGLPTPGADHDIMLLHHALQPEMEKSLGFMASIYTDELAWKFMRPKHTVKKED